ncbi:MAG: KTSC domain-containing protein [Bacteroidota bacterium]
MKRILDYRNLFGTTKESNLKELKKRYRDLIKDHHPDKFQDEKEKLAAELKSKEIIEAYHFLNSISPETRDQNLEEYTKMTATTNIEDFLYKGLTLKITFQDKSVYEYYGVPKSVYTKLVNSPTQTRFARRHIYTSYTYRNVMKQAEQN